MNESYKQSQIGKIPKEWKIVRLEKTGKIVNGFGFPIKFQGKKDGKYIFCKVSDTNLQGNEKYLSTAKNTIDDNLVKKMKVQIYPKGTIVFPKIGMVIYLKKVRILDTPGTFDNNMMGVIPDHKVIDKEFLYYYFLAKIDLTKLSGSTTVPSIRKSEVEKLWIAIPPLPKQRRIAEVLTRVDDAIQKVDEAIAKTKQLKKGLMRKLFTVGIGHKEFKRTKIGNIPKEWRLSNLSYYADIRYGLGQPTERDPEGVPMIRATNIKAGKIVESDLVRLKESKIPYNKNPFLKEGEIIVVRSGVYTGDIARINKKWEGSIVGYDLVITPHKNINSSFLTYWLLSSHIQKKYFFSLKTRSAQPHLNKNQLSRTPIPLPPIGEQKKIADVLSTIDEKLDLDRKRKEKLERIKQGLMNDLLTGKRRVKVAM